MFFIVLSLIGRHAISFYLLYQFFTLEGEEKMLAFYAWCIIFVINMAYVGLSEEIGRRGRGV